MALTRTELRRWLEVTTGFHALLGALDAELRRDSGISHDDYMVLTVLARERSGGLRMSELAARVSSSPSRMTHSVTRFEQQGWVERRRDEPDGRGVSATLTAAGREKLQQASIGHLSLVKELVFEQLEPEAIRALSESMSQIRHGASSRT
jgi:DNA-binding MarR family transcriptional regulator